MEGLTEKEQKRKEKWKNLGFFYKEPFYKKAKELIQKDYPVGLASIDEIAEGIFIYDETIKD